MSHFKMDICDIRQAAIAWKIRHNPPLHEFRDFVVHFANDNGYRVTGSFIDEEFFEVHFSTAEVIRFHRQQLR